MPEKAKPNAPTWVKVLVGLHVMAVTIWALPDPRPDAISGKRAPIGTEWILYWNHQHLKQFQPVRTYTGVTGFWQYWDMFSPNPAQEDIWVDAEVIYKDGTSKIYQYPRMFLLSIPEKFLKERYRKFYERVNSDTTPYLRSVFAQRIAHLSDNPSNPPVTVKLRRHWLLIVAPGKPQETKYSDYVYFVHAVDPKKLEQDRKDPL
jgi:hypothetical protein